MTWKQFGNESDIAPGTVQVVETAGLRLALCNTGTGIYAIDDVCTHDGGPLDQGFLEGNQIECPRHGARFDVTNGRVLRLPAVRNVKSYPARVENGIIEIDVP
jgi:3-phenylpropionate/trans-cinnamate dioxygenase ferredoxin subunit